MVTNQLTITVFLSCSHTFSESMPHTLRTLHTNQKTLTMGKTPLFSRKNEMFKIQNSVMSSQNGILFSNDAHKPSYEYMKILIKHYDE